MAATPEPRWTVESAHPGLPYLRWSDDLFLDMGGMDPEAWAALVADVEAARQLPAIEALLNFERTRADHNAQLIGKHDPTGPEGT